MIQQGQVFKLKAKSMDGQTLWAYRYRLEGRSSARPQAGRFASWAEAQKALRKALDRVGPGRGGAITLSEFVDEYWNCDGTPFVGPVVMRVLVGCRSFVGVRIRRVSCT
jgi:hypothetical protein